MLDQLGITKKDIGDRNFFFGSGCEECSNSGYRGRTGLFEMIKVLTKKITTSMRGMNIINDIF